MSENTCYVFQTHGGCTHVTVRAGRAINSAQPRQDEAGQVRSGQKAWRQRSGVPIGPEGTRPAGR
eukprot:2993395-Heterocapsa_arctica.AAC.1